MFQIYNLYLFFFLPSDLFWATFFFWLFSVVESVHWKRRLEALIGSTLVNSAQHAQQPCTRLETETAVAKENQTSSGRRLKEISN